jgi:hypothetical protein
MMTAYSDREFLDFLQGSIAAHEGGTTVSLGYDDATFQYTLSISGKLFAYSKDFKHMIALAINKEKKCQD